MSDNSTKLPNSECALQAGPIVPACHALPRIPLNLLDSYKCGLERGHHGDHRAITKERLQWHDEPVERSCAYNVRGCTVGHTSDTNPHATVQSEDAKCSFPGCEYLPSSLFHSSHNNGCLLPHGHEPAMSCHPYRTVQAQGDILAPLQPKLAAYETLMHKGKMVEDAGGWHDQKAFNEWNRLVTETHRDLCHAVAAIVGERVMNAVQCGAY